MGKYLIVGIMLGFLGLSIWLAFVGWNLHDDEVEMTGQGYMAMALGIVFSVVVGIGLMSLIFYSHRKGYDEPAEQVRRNEDPK
jgi:hypothetical protein